jgi:hypothetical protein
MGLSKKNMAATGLENSALEFSPCCCGGNVGYTALLGKYGQVHIAIIDWFNLRPQF